MPLQNGQLLATVLASQVSQQLPSAHRGAALVRCEEDSTLVAAVFGNEPYEEEATHHKVEEVRDWLREADIEELGFGLSDDSTTWALILRLEGEQYETSAGKQFYVEMVQARLDNVVHTEWRTGWEQASPQKAWHSPSQSPAIG